MEEIAWAQEGARLAEETGDHRQRSVFLNYLGITYANIGQVHQSMDILQEAAKIGEEIQDNSLLFDSLTNIT
jgi:hypothetical protein